MLISKLLLESIHTPNMHTKRKRDKLPTLGGKICGITGDSIDIKK